MSVSVALRSSPTVHVGVIATMMSDIKNVTAAVTTATDADHTSSTDKVSKSPLKLRNVESHQSGTQMNTVGGTTTKAVPHPQSTKQQVKATNINVTDERFHLTIITLLGCVLSQLIAFEESQYPNGRGSVSMFHTAYVPSIPIGAYLKRIALYTKVSSETLIQSVLHIHRLMQRTSAPMIVNKLNIHRLLLTSIMTTAKFFDDAHHNSAYFSYIGGVPLRELNTLEVEFLSLLNFDFYINTQTYQYFYSMVIDRNIHIGTQCDCYGLLEGLPKTLDTCGYIDDSKQELPEIDTTYTSHIETFGTNEESVEMSCTPIGLVSSDSASSNDSFVASTGRTAAASAAAASITPKQQPRTISVVAVPRKSIRTADEMMHAGMRSMQIDSSTNTHEVMTTVTPTMDTVKTPVAPSKKYLRHEDYLAAMSLPRTPKRVSAPSAQPVALVLQPSSTSPTSRSTPSIGSTFAYSPSSVGSYSSLSQSSYHAPHHFGATHSPSLSLSGACLPHHHRCHSHVTNDGSECCDGFHLTPRQSPQPAATTPLQNTHIRT